MSKKKDTKTLALDTLETAKGILERARELGEQAEKTGDVRTAMLGLREMARATELYARLAGELQETGALVDPRFSRVRDAILSALRPYPEAREAVFRALSETDASDGANLDS